MVFMSESPAAWTLRRERIGRAGGLLRSRRRRGPAKARDDRHTFANILALDGRLLSVGHAGSNADRRELPDAVGPPDQRTALTLRRIEAGLGLHRIRGLNPERAI